MKPETAPTPPNAIDLGFTGNESTGWVLPLRGRQVHFRVLRTLDELAAAERLQMEVFGVSERDLIPANELIVVAETGGAVLGAFLPEHAEHAAGVIVGWGGYVGHPRIVSDFLAVRPEVRNLGLASELKRLQAAIAFERGFQEIVWTVDPLRAANARLNFEKLGAISTSYEIDRYGSSFAPVLYGGMPSDRLHITWDLTSRWVIRRLLGRTDQPPFPSPPLPPYAPGTNQNTARISIPADIDRLLSTSPEEAHRWRLHVREALIAAFSEGFAITGFQPAHSNGNPDLILERLPPGKS